VVTKKVIQPEVESGVPAEAGTVEAVWYRDATAEAHPEYAERPDSEALTDEQKEHLRENGLL